MQAVDPTTDQQHLPPDHIETPELDEAELQRLYAWVDEIPLSRPKRNFARDFSDAMLTAEILRFYLPKLVEVHNYPPASSVSQKLVNWHTLNYKVLRKIHFNLSDDTIQLVVNCYPGAIESVLHLLRQKIEEFLSHPTPLKPYEAPPPPNNLKLLPVKKKKPPPTKVLPKARKRPAQPRVVMKAPVKQKPSALQTNQSSLPPPERKVLEVVKTQAKPKQHEKRESQEQSFQRHDPGQNQHLLPLNQSLKAHSRVPSKNNAILNRDSNEASRKNVASKSEQLQGTPMKKVDHKAGASEKDQMILELQDTVEILQVKIAKMEQLLALKDRRIRELTSGAASEQSRPARRSKA